MLADSQSRQQTPQGGKIAPDKWPVMPFFNSMSPYVWLGDRTCVQLIDVTAKILSTKYDGVSVEHTPQHVQWNSTPFARNGVRVDFDDEYGRPQGKCEYFKGNMVARVGAGPLILKDSSSGLI
jgi:hypothetical protein